MRLICESRRPVIMYRSQKWATPPSSTSIQIHHSSYFPRALSTEKQSLNKPRHNTVFTLRITIISSNRRKRSIIFHHRYLSLSQWAVGRAEHKVKICVTHNWIC